MSSNVFKDATGAEWSVVIDVAAQKRMRMLANGFTLDGLIPKDDAMPVGTKEERAKVAEEYARRYADFLNDDLRLSEVLYAILKPLLDAAKVTQDDFDARLSGDVLFKAGAAFHGAFTDFSHGPRKAILRGIRMELKKVGTSFAKLDEMSDAQIEQAIDEAREQSKNSAGNTPEPSESTQAA